MRHLFYNWSDWEETQWRYHKMTHPGSKDTEETGCERYEGFDSFAMDQFHWLYADEHRPVSENETEKVESDAVFEKMHGLREDIPELADLRADCMGDDIAAGIATAAVLDDLMRLVEAPDAPVESSAEDHQAAQALEQFIAHVSAQVDQNGVPMAVAELEEALEEVQATIARKEAHAQQVAQLMDETDIRNALRQAAKSAKEAIQDYRSMMGGWGAGDEAHSGALASRAQANALRDRLRGNDRLQRIGRIAGRLKRHALEKQREKAKYGIDEVVDIELGNDMNRMLPSEMIWMDDDLDHVFIQKLDNHTLAQKKMRGKDKETQGPIIALVDSSGSMEADECDIWAAGYCLALLEIAVKQNRDFAIVHFGSGVLRTDFFEKDQKTDVHQRMDAISFFAADGGTSFRAPIRAGIELIEEHGSFRKADLVLITDGCARIPDDFAAWYKAKQEELHFNLYALLVINRYSDQMGANLALRKLTQEIIDMRSMEDDEDAMEVFSNI